MMNEPFSVDEFRRLCSRATPPPWAFSNSQLCNVEGLYLVGLTISNFDETSEFANRADAEFCAYVGTHRETILRMLEGK